MIGYLRGKILDHQDGKLLLGISGSSEDTVGYQVSVPQSAEYGAWTEGKTIEVFIHTHVREDALDLYGFASRIEKDLYLTLLTVNGIGPKGALTILTNVPAPHLVDFILRGDKDGLVKVPGVGKKTAERLVLELADPLRKKMEAGLLGDLGKTSRASNAKYAAGASFRDTAVSATGEIAIIRDAREALVSLGYREQDVHPLMKELLEELTEKNNGAPRTEDLIRFALQRLG